MVLYSQRNFHNEKTSHNCGRDENLMDDLEQLKKFRKKYGTPFFTAICIRSGRMKTEGMPGLQEYFCREGKKYKYILVDDPDDPIRMKSECDKEFVHMMSWNFFNKYYVKCDEEDFIKTSEMTL
jgi:hypothetical protein